MNFSLFIVMLADKYCAFLLIFISIWFFSVVSDIFMQFFLLKFNWSIVRTTTRCLVFLHWLFYIVKHLKFTVWCLCETFQFVSYLHWLVLSHLYWLSFSFYFLFVMSYVHHKLTFLSHYTFLSWIDLKFKNRLNFALLKKLITLFVR